MFRRDDDKEREDSLFTRRVAMLGTGQLVAFGLIGARLYQIQVYDEDQYAPKAENNRIDVRILAPKRGRILDRTGIVLADNRETFQAILIPALTSGVKDALERFQRVLPLGDDDIDRLIKRAKRQSRSTPLVVRDGLSFEEVAKLNVLAPQLPGIETDVVWRRRYFGGVSAAHLVGYVGNVEKPGSEEVPLLRLPGMRVGKTGVEAGMEEELRGDGGSAKIEVDARGHIVRTLERIEPATGNDIVTTLDVTLQKRVLDMLAGQRRAAVVVLDAVKGDLVVLASVPTFDPGPIVDGLDDESWQAIISAPDKPMLNRCVSGLYPPASTFKMVTALAALEAGVLSLSEKIDCQGRFDVGDQSFRCWNRSGHGRLAFSDALAKSCDVFFYELAQRLGIEAIADMARRLGFGQSYDMGVAEIGVGLVPDPEWKRERFRERWLAGETILASIGQGFVLATPVQLAVMTARIATGRVVVPRVVRRIGPIQANEVETAEIGEFELLRVAPEWLKAVRLAMSGVINEGGTGSAARLDDGDVRFAGKTGTSQVRRTAAPEEGGSLQNEIAWEDRDHSLFVGYAPDNDARYAISVVVEHGGNGSAVAAPLARDIMRMVLQVNPAGKRLNVDDPAAASQSVPSQLKDTQLKDRG